MDCIRNGRIVEVTVEGENEETLHYSRRGTRAKREIQVVATKIYQEDMKGTREEMELGETR